MKNKRTANKRTSEQANKRTSEQANKRTSEQANNFNKILIPFQYYIFLFLQSNYSQRYKNKSDKTLKIEYCFNKS